MPELPEVQTIVNGLKDKIIGKEIIGIDEFRNNTVHNKTGRKISEFGKIKNINRIGKYIIISTSSDIKLVVHLRMTGKLIFKENANINPAHLRAQFNFQDGSVLYFDDTRNFGFVNIYKKTQSVDYLRKLGPDALSCKFSEEYLNNVIQKRKAPIKNLLLNQSVVAGLGNIYVAEILYRAKLSPMRKSYKLNFEEVQRIVEITKKVLKKAIKHNGTTISDYRNIDEKSGEFQNFLRIYGKLKCSCGEDVNKVKQAGRTTYFCPQCQT
ncbi:MAG: bifunctional DNA-formamidopyrimidine glycosylase/DNA-(apurinic or apyrimidinic site) lyase [Candidatus Cloacimonadota bacterium]|nr:bifunctional DNA-formamidopyrimidine glycosylase/DNA-(apurinic or apyrimidinic site) lyase [Candidatus Cloacimonadota bacterium]